MVHVPQIASACHHIVNVTLKFVNVVLGLPNRPMDHANLQVRLVKFLIFESTSLYCYFTAYACVGGAKPLEDASGTVECELTPAFITAAGKRKKRQAIMPGPMPYPSCSSEMFTDNCADGYYCVPYGMDPMITFDPLCNGKIRI